MIGLVIITHGELAKSFVLSLELIAGPQQNIETICIKPDDDMDQQRTNILKAIKTVDQNKGVILLTDLFGGTPSNLALSILGLENIEVIGGVNLPMLLKLIALRSKLTLQEAVEQAQEAARKHIHIASSLLVNQNPLEAKAS
ncbi:MAG: PTS sugar transporter subunit IIA [Alphaproteobacteria bacterium]|jgi:mannose PTS system EIIA component|nr:PTS sugar transporter subunit IIA [Alphaproteobacteria bacterium]